MRKSVFASLVLLLAMTPTARSQKSTAAKTPKQPQRARASEAASPAWVEQTLKSMTLREKLGQLLMPVYFSVFLSTESAEYKELVHQVEGNHIGGLIVGTTRGPLGIERSQVWPTAVITNQLQSRAKIPLLIGADFESGTGMRLDEGTSFPSAMAVGATGDPRLAYETGKITALEARAAGVQWIFAPDSDVNSNPDNPIINIRSYSEDPDLVADFVAQFVRGVEENGALATAKHFPGHGNVNTDSHLGLPTVPGTREQLENTELAPFRAAIQAGAGSVMPGHLFVPSFEPDAGTPATLSQKILTELLRDEMRFHGLIVTDAMDMGGVTNLYTQGEAAVRAIEAGADVLLQPLVPDAALEGLETAVKSGRLPMARVDASVRRILTAKARLGLDKKRLVDVVHLNEHFGLPEYEQRAQNIADRGVTLLRNSSQLVPLDATQLLRLLLVAISADADPFPAQDLEPEIRWRVDSLKTLRADTQFTNVNTLKLPPPDSYDVAIAALFVRVADRKGNVGFPEEQRAFVNQLLATGKPCAVIGFGSPYLIERFPNAKTWISEFSTNDVSQRAAARALFGQVPIGGQIPVTVPGTTKRGDGLHMAENPMTVKPPSQEMEQQLQPAFELLDRGVTEGAFPGGVLAVGLRDRLVVHPFGKMSVSPRAPAVTADTIYDVASLTKAVVTTTSIMMLVQRQRLNLDLAVARLLPEFGAAAKGDPDPNWRAAVTVRNLLLHDAGLPAHRDYYKEEKGYDAMLARVMAEPLVREPGKQVEYSDLGFILLGEIVHRVTGKPLDEFAREDILQPLAMKNTEYNPSRRLRALIAPTEEDKEYRRRLVAGEVHDENSYAMGGVAGHAGLFSTAGDLSAFAQMILNGGIYAHHRLLWRTTIQQFTARVPVGNSARALGWDVPTENSSTGHYFSPHSFGHNGFTGTSMWFDPDRELFVILLTNRVNPTRANEKIRQVRPALHDTILESLGLAADHATAQ